MKSTSVSRYNIVKEELGVSRRASRDLSETIELRKEKREEPENNLITASLNVVFDENRSASNKI